MSPRATAADIDAWTHLVVLTEAAVKRPASSPVNLERAAWKAFKACLPCEPFSASNPYVAMLKEVQGYVGLLAVDRTRHADRLSSALDAAMAHHRLGLPATIPPPPEPELPARPFRADIDG